MLLCVGAPAYGEETYQKLLATQFLEDPDDPARLTDDKQNEWDRVVERKGVKK